jgi:ribosomal protein L29
MFGHGQVEGFSEKYGMEYRKAKWEETPDEGLIRGHEWRIFPLLHRRYLFADVEQFLLYDFYSPNGSVDEEVFAYSNRFNDERGLIVYHNKFADTRGWIKTSAAYIDKGSGKTVRRNIAEGIGLPRVGYVIFKDYVTQLEYIRSCKEIWDKGMYIELGAYQCHAFMDWRFVGDSEWKTICNQLNGAGVQSMQDEWRKLFSVVEEVKVDVEVVKPKKARAVRKTAAKVKTVKSEKKVKSKPALRRSEGKEKAVAVKPVKAKKAVVKKIVPAKAKPEKKVAAKTKPSIKKAVKKTVKPKKVVQKKPEKKKTTATKKK